jgi:hypothetical protein
VSAELKPVMHFEDGTICIPYCCSSNGSITLWFWVAKHTIGVVVDMEETDFIPFVNSVVTWWLWERWVVTLGEGPFSLEGKMSLQRRRTALKEILDISDIPLTRAVGVILSKVSDCII